MKHIISKIAITLLAAFILACEDEAKDPIKFNEVKKATYLALRGDAYQSLLDTDCSNSFFKNNIAGNEAFTIDADFLSEDQETLQEVQLYAEIAKQVSRVQVATFPGSIFTFPADSKIKRGKISVPLATILSKLGLTTATAANIGKDKHIAMSIDLILTDGSKVFASSFVNPNLTQSVIFYPAMNLTYCTNDADDFRPTASTTLLGTWATKDKTPASAGKTVVRTPIPSLKNGSKDTLYIKFDNDIITPPTVSFSPSSAGSASALVKAKERNADGFNKSTDDSSAFYLIYTANGTYTGAVTATVSGATAEVGGVILTQKAEKQVINVDNTSPVVLSVSTGKRIGKGQFVTMKVTLNEKLSTKSTNAIKVTVDGSARGLETVTDAKMTVASDGLSASLVYVFKPAVPTIPASHGNLTVKFSSAIDEAGNSTPISDGSLTVDVGIPPAPSITKDPVKHDYGTRILWTADVTTGGSNPGGSVSGLVYFIAVETGVPKPTGFSVDLDGIATWIMPNDPSTDPDPDKQEPYPIEDEGTIEVDGGTSDPVFTDFVVNGTFDIYAVFVSSSGTISDITSAPQLMGVVME